MNYPFDDYLQLFERRLADKRLIVFIGCSGAGKSSYIETLLSRHPDYGAQKIARIVNGRPLMWNETLPQEPCLIVVDELLVWTDLWQIAKLLRAGHRLLVASHLPAYWHWPLRLLGSMASRRPR